jgi:hypothetical protein
MSFKLDKNKIKTLALLNPAVFKLSFVGIGFQDESNGYLLVVFKNKEVIFHKIYKTMGWAKRAFKRIFSKGSDTKPEWAPFVFCYSSADKKRIVKLGDRNG